MENAINRLHNDLKEGKKIMLCRTFDHVPKVNSTRSRFSSNFIVTAEFNVHLHVNTVKSKANELQSFLIQYTCM